MFSSSLSRAINPLPTPSPLPIFLSCLRARARTHSPSFCLVQTQSLSLSLCLALSLSFFLVFFLSISLSRTHAPSFFLSSVAHKLPPQPPPLPPHTLSRYLAARCKGDGVECRGAYIRSAVAELWRLCQSQAACFPWCVCVCVCVRV